MGRLRDRRILPQRVEVPGTSLSEVGGFSLEADATGTESFGSEVSPYTDAGKLEVVCPDDRVEALAGAIAGSAQTGRRGDGKVFVLPVHCRIDMRTYAASGEDAGEN